ncbi:OmpA family protein [Tropicimonas sp. S265A]|uniref:OmpA family protein n=1 Tax=Tropicimonas sp. S265A TaxID=3415134 RepID=UPI003C7A3DD4
MKLTTLLLGIGFGLLASTASGQDYSSEELKQLFERQKGAVSEGLGTTRGLRIRTQEEAESAGAATVQTESAVVANSVGGATAANVPVQPVSLPADIQINLRISFDYDSAALKPSEQAKLAPMCDAIQTSDVEVLRVVGHTDSSGSDAYNQQLSQLRAEEVARYLVDQCNVDPSRLQTMGLGETAPLNAANPRADENRRVEFQALS